MLNKNETIHYVTQTWCYIDMMSDYVLAEKRRENCEMCEYS